MIKIIQIGMGPLGVKIGQFIHERQGLETVGAVDLNPSIAGKSYRDLIERQCPDIKVVASLGDVEKLNEADIVVLTTVSDLERIVGQIDSILDYGLPVISTCEELTYPFINGSELGRNLDAKAKAKNLAVLSTGVNPGFLMDTLPAMLTSVCQDVQHISVYRMQDARHRRIPFQNKIGAGLNLDEFEERNQSGTLRHVGLTESMHFIANSLGWKLDRTEDIITPVIAEDTIVTEARTIEKGSAMGVRQEGRAFIGETEMIELIFEAAVGSGESYDKVKITGSPNIESMIDGGVNGDIATCAIVLNAIPSVLRASPGLNTMATVGLVSRWS